MISPAFGLGWHLWRRYRLFALSFLTYGIMLAISVPAIVRLHLNGVALVAAGPLEIALFITIALFSNPDADIVGRNSGYPAYLLTLPVRTVELVLWPMLACIGTVVLSWLALGHLILHPLGLALPLWWPALILAGLVACIQAVYWLPLGIPYLRLILLLTIILLVVGAGVRGSVLLAPGALAALFLVIIAIAYRIAVYGVARTRRGDTLEWTLPQQRTDSALRVQKPFRSPQQAELWYEWRRNGLLLPLVVGGLFLFIFACSLRSPERVALDLLHPLVPSEQEVQGVGGILVNVGVKLGMFLGLALTPMLAMAIGCGVWRPDNRKPDQSLNPFYAARPLTSAEMIFAKFKMAAHSTLLTWGIVLLFEILILLRPAQEGTTTAPLGLLLFPYITLKTGILAILVLLAALIQTWKSQVSALFINLCGRPWIVHTYAGVTAGLQTGVIMLAVWLNTQHPEMWTHVLPALPSLLFCTVLLKLGLSVWSLRRCCQRHLLQPPTAIKIGLGWLSIALASWLLLCWLLDCNLPTAGELLCSILLFLPLARPALAPLAIDWNRHR
ncbi:MAG: hypothetical protein JWN14_1416 [Chthonomonadales bacterium]|nr:hypothetical protein [Chthonomonadales bacterium]